MTRTRITTLAALLLAALFLAGCGGSGGGEPTVTQTLHDELQAELDAALADLTEERKAKADEEAARETAEGEVTRLGGELETANNNVDSLTDRIGTADDADSLQGMLAAEKARVTTLMNQIGTAPGGDDTGGSGLRKDLADAKANVARLTAQIGTAEDADSLQGMLKAEKDEVTRLTTLIGAEANEADADGSLYAQLKYAKAEVMRLTGEIGTASDSDSLKGMLEAEKLEVIRLKSQVITLNERITGLQSQLADASTDVTDAEQRADQAERKADQRVAKIERQGDTNARAQGLLDALKDVLADNRTTWETPDNTASADINARDTDIELTASPLQGSTRKSGDFYNATLTRTAPGVSQPERKTVVYTDREKTRTFANHYASSIASNVGGTTSNPRFQHTTWAPAADNLDLLGNDVMTYVSKPSRGGHPSTIANDAANNPANRIVSSLSAKVHGVSGRYGCYNNASGQACNVIVAATYDVPSDDPTGRKELTSLAIKPEPNGMLYFDPGSGTISLLNVPKPGAPRTTDRQYMTFGWWQESPAMSDGAHQAAVFAGTTGAYTGTLTGSAEYEGPAVGLYVDRTSEGGTTVYESGDFTATTILRATFTGTDTGVQGDVTNFRTTHGTKNWHVRLNPTSASPANATGTAEIVQAGTSSEGMWERTFLARHGMVDEDDEQPIAVTGRFDVSIPNLRHIVGAFGAHRTTDPVGQ